MVTYLSKGCLQKSNFNVEFITLHLYSLYLPRNYCTCRQQVCAGGRDILTFFPLPVTGSLRWTMIHNQHQDHYPASRGLFLESTLFLDPPDWSRKIEETSGRRVYTQEYFFVFYHHTQKKHWKPSMRFILNNIATGSIYYSTRNQFQWNCWNSSVKIVFSS